MLRRIGPIPLLASLSLIVVSAIGAEASTSTFAVPKPTPDTPGFTEYKGIKIGTAADAVRAKLGAPKEKSDTQDQYVFSEHESVQFFYDSAHLVSAIMVTFTGDIKNAPLAKDIFGVEVPPGENGMIFKMERYPKLGYWISYTKTTGDGAMVNIAIQKM